MGQLFDSAMSRFTLSVRWLLVDCSAPIEFLLNIFKSFCKTPSGAQKCHLGLEGTAIEYWLHVPGQRDVEDRLYLTGRRVMEDRLHVPGQRSVNDRSYLAGWGVAVDWLHVAG